MMNYALASYRFKNQVSSIIAPDWTAEKAGKLFLTPKRLPIKEWENIAESRGTRFQLSDEISGIRWSPDTAIPDASPTKQILLVHGWESRATQMYGFVISLLTQGYEVIAIDMPGHGQSSGITSNAFMFMKTIQLAQAKLGHFHTIIGHSMGAGATAIAVGKGVTADNLVLISGPSSIDNVLRRFSKFVGLNKNTSNKFVSFIGKQVGVPATELDSTTLLKQCAIRTLLIHDQSDIEVPISESRRLVSAFTNAELFVTKGLGHRKILKDTSVLAKIEHFIASAN